MADAAPEVEWRRLRAAAPPLPRVGRGPTILDETVLSAGWRPPP